MVLYTKYHTSRNDERRGLFEIARTEFGVERGLYPGCFVHVTPSFCIERMVYVDSDARAAAFFADGAVRALVEREKVYDSAAEIIFYRRDYRAPLPLVEETFDLLISQYAGPISEHCKRYLRPGGILLANNSHGDAGLADNDPEFQFVAVINRRGQRYSLSTRDLDAHFVPKTRILSADRAEVRDYLLRLGRGVGYTKRADNYVFRKRSFMW
jgi:SAM-dependent methyltransferase